MFVASTSLIVFFILMISVPTILVGSLIGLIVGAIPGMSIVLSKGQAAMAGGIGALIGAWSSFAMSWRFVPAEPWIPFFILGGIAGAVLMTLIVIFWYKKCTTFKDQSAAVSEKDAIAPTQNKEDVAGAPGTDKENQGNEPAVRARTGQKGPALDDH